MTDLMDIHLNGYDLITKEVKKMATSGIAYVPKEWIGKKVRIVLMEKIED